MDVNDFGFFYILVGYLVLGLIGLFADIKQHVQFCAVVCSI